MKKWLTTTMIAAALVVPAVAQDPAPQAAGKQSRIEKRKQMQQKRIAAGAKSGQLTPAETAKLEAKEAKLNQEIRKDRKDGGGMTKGERAKTEAKQDRLSKQIAKQKHDKQKTK